jgi:hypothetical protein
MVVATTVALVPITGELFQSEKPGTALATAPHAFLRSFCQERIRDVTDLSIDGVAVGDPPSVLVGMAGYSMRWRVAGHIVRGVGLTVGVDVGKAGKQLKRQPIGHFFVVTRHPHSRDALYLMAAELVKLVADWAVGPYASRSGSTGHDRPRRTLLGWCAHDQRNVD